MVNYKNISFNIDSKYSSILSDDEIAFLKNTEFIQEINIELNLKDNIDKINFKDFDQIVLIGFGGSSLGTKSIYNALYHERNLKKIFFIDNLETETFNFVMSQVNKENTLFLFVSKSGNTFEVLSILQYMLEEGYNKNNFHFMTQDSKSKMREIADKNNISYSLLNNNLGGRFSVLSLSTFLPLDLVGCNWTEIKNSALNFYINETKNSFQISSGLINFYLNNYQNGKNISCFMPYSSRLSSFSEWIMQLFGESLGKKNVGDYPVALTPISYLGPKDQHSQLQLVLDGPKDKTLSFFNFDNNIFESKLNELSRIEQIATIGALKEVGVPYIEISSKNLDENYLGVLFIIFEITVSIIALRLGVNPFDQPAVELIKKRINK